MQFVLCAILTLLIVRANEGLFDSKLDQEWLQMLETPPQRAVDLANELSKRASTIADGLIGTMKPLGDMDVVVSGGGNFDAYYMGISMILNRVEQHSKELVHRMRWAGASAGGMMPFELALKGENNTLTMHLAFGVLSEEHKTEFSFAPSAAYLQDHLWRVMAHWMVQKYSSTIYTLDDRVFLALSCLNPLPTLVMVSNFTSPDQTEHAFMGTGTYLEMYDSMVCSDGGAMSGPKMTPLFQDKKRPQLIVDLMQTGYPSSMVWGYNVSEYVSLIKKGQNDAATFLMGNSIAKDAIFLCPTSADVSSKVCKQ